MVVQCIKALPSNARGTGSIPSREVKVPHALGSKKQNIKKQKQYCNKFNKDFKIIHIKKSLKKKDSSFLILFICTNSAGRGRGGEVWLHSFFDDPNSYFPLPDLLPIGLKLGGIRTDGLQQQVSPGVGVGGFWLKA